jgi:hypothetical protein
MRSLCFFLGIFLLFFLPLSTFIDLYPPLLTFIGTAPEREFGGVFGSRRRVGGARLMGRKGQTGRKGLRRGGPGTVPHAARAGWTCRAALI